MRCRTNWETSSNISTNSPYTINKGFIISANHHAANELSADSKTLKESKTHYSSKRKPHYRAARRQGKSSPPTTTTTSVFKPRCRKLTRLPRTEIMGYLHRSEYKAEAPTPPYTTTAKNRTQSNGSTQKPPLLRSSSFQFATDLGPPDFDNTEERYSDEDEAYNMQRQRTNKQPTNWEKLSKDNQHDINDRKILAIMLNLAHIVVGIAITQLGIVGAWYQRYMNFQEDQLRHVLYICVLFIVTGSYGMFLIMKRLCTLKAHRTAYIVLSILTISASSFIIANGVRLVLADNYQSHQLVIVIFDGLLIGLSCIEIPIALVSIYKTVPDPSKLFERHLSTNELLKGDELSIKDKPPPTWGSIFSMILNVAHIVLGLCIIELGTVGMLYRSLMNIDGTGLFAIVFTSLTFITTGMIGIYNQLTGRAGITCNRCMYMGASLLGVGCSSTIMSFISVTMNSNQYYAGIEAIVAFDVMILSMSGMELIVGLAATALCLIPICLTKFRDNMSTVSS